MSGRLAPTRGGRRAFQVTNFFAAAHRSGSPEDLKELIDTATEEGVESVTVALGNGGGHKRITIRTSALEEKASAIGMLSTYAEELKAAFFPYVGEVAQVLLPLIKFQYLDDVRLAAMGAMPELLGSAIGALSAGMPGASADIIVQLKSAITMTTLEQLKLEQDAETLSQVLAAFLCRSSLAFRK